MQGTVNEIGQSQTGKPKVKIEGQWYSAGRTDVTGMQVGMRVEFEGAQFTFNNKQMWGLNKWKVLKDPVTGQPQIAKTAVSDDATMRFISNVVGSAITAGTIKEPTQLASWVSAARGALNEKPEATREQATAAVDPEFNDAIPEGFYEGLPPQRSRSEPTW